MSDLDHRILVMDDEFSNVDALLNFFERVNLDYNYEEDLATGLEDVQKSISEGHPYDLIISDNHFKETGLEGYGTNVEGVDVLNMLLGKEPLLDPAKQRIARHYFPQTFPHYIHDFFQGKLIMFSGSAFKDSQYNADLYDGIVPIQKIRDQYGQPCCEQMVIEVIDDILGTDLSRKSAEIKDYKEDNDLHQGLYVKPPKIETEHEKMVREFLMKHGNDSDLELLNFKETEGFEEYK
jgi:CheY-like chemotaxis protein